MRGIAAILVVLTHFSGSYDAESGSGNLAPHAYGAVDFFFVLSGFVIAHSYESALLRGGLSFSKFMTARLVRLYPLILLGLMLGLAKQLIGLAMARPEALPPYRVAAAALFNAVLLPDMVSDKVATLNGPSWSLTFEIIANVGFAGLFVFLSLRKLTAAILLAAVLLAGAIWFWGSGDIGWSVSTSVGGLLRVVFGFSTGLLLHRLIRRPPRLSWWAALFPLALAVILADSPETWRAPVDIILVLLVYPLIVLSGTLVDIPRSARRVCDWLGTISYPLYIIHFPPLAIGVAIASKLHLGPWVAALGYAIVMSAISLLVARFYDDPVRHWLSRKWQVRYSAPARIED